jgi:hypothetical protein
VDPTAVLVTADGKRALPESDPFFARLHHLVAARPAGDFAVRSLGFVRFRSAGGGLTTIELHPQTVDRRALAAAERRIAAFAAERFRIVYLDAGFPSQTALTAAAAIARLRDLREPQAGALRAERFRVEPQDYARLLRDEANPLRRMNQRWRAASAAFDPTVLPFAAEAGLAAMMTVALVPPRGGPPLCRYIGDGFPWLGADDRRRVVGERFENFPDREYGAWSAGFFVSVAASGAPRHDRVTAVLHRDGDPNRTYLAGYERLMLPWRSPSGEMLVTTTARRIETPAARP